MANLTATLYITIKTKVGKWTTVRPAMSDNIDWIALAIFVFFLALVTVMGFVAARWKAGPVGEHLDEWGLGGRQFGTWITWFLVGGDFYTAYTVIAVPALVYAVGAYGFFALPYTIIVYPFVFAVMPLLWKVAHARGHVTAADVVHDAPASTPQSSRCFSRPVLLLQRATNALEPRRSERYRNLTRPAIIPDAVDDGPDELGLLARVEGFPDRVELSQRFLQISIVDHIRRQIIQVGSKLARLGIRGPYLFL